MLSLLLAALLSANGTGKTLVRQSPGRTVTGPTAARGPAFVDDANTVCHAYWDGVQIRDTKGCAWTMQGTVAQLARAGRTPPGSTYSSSTSYTLGTGSEVFDQAGDFTLVVVFQSADVASEQVLLSNADGTYGWFLEQTAAKVVSLGVRGCTAATTATAIPAGSLSVACIGRSGSTWYAKANLGTAVHSGACATYAGNCTSGGNCSARIGGYPALSALYSRDNIYEVFLSAATVSDALCTSMASHAKARYGIAAW